MQQENKQQQLTANFLKEFSQQQSSSIAPSLQLNSHSQLNTQIYAQRPQHKDFKNLSHQSLHPMHYFNNYVMQHHNQQHNPSLKPDAIDQLENKYRNDMIAQTSSEKYDDIQFWQTLSQAYMGPRTISKPTSLGVEKPLQEPEATRDELTSAEELPEELSNFVEELNLGSPSRDLDYAFDERNPLKDRFDDPFAEGLRRLEIGDIPSAALLFEAALQREPTNALAWQYLGTTQAQNEKDRSAITALQNCLKYDESNQQARLAIAASLVNETRYHEACNHLIEWLVRHEKYGNAVGASLEEYKQLNTTLKRDEGEFMSGLPKQHYEYVKDKFFNAARMSPSNPDPEVQNSLGVLFNMRGEYDKAVDCFKAALSVKSEDSLLWNRLGATLANGNKSEEAVVAYRRALEIAPGFLRSRYNLAISLIHLNLYDEAARQLVQILNIQVAGNDGRVRYTDSSIRNRSITSTSIWNTLRTVATLMNKPELYPHIDGRNLDKCNEALLNNVGTSASTSSN